MNNLERRFDKWMDDSAGSVLLMPAILIVLLLSLFPLLVSLYLSFSRVQFVKGGFTINWVGLSNYNKLLLGGEQMHMLGQPDALSLVGWLLLIACAAFLVVMWVRYVLSPRRRIFGAIMRLVV